MTMSDRELLATYLTATRPFGFEAAGDSATITAGLRAVVAADRAAVPGTDKENN